MKGREDGERGEGGEAIIWGRQLFKNVSWTGTIIRGRRGTATICGNMVYDMHIIISSVSIISELKNHDEVHNDDICWLGKDWNENVSFGEKKET